MSTLTDPAMSPSATVPGNGAAPPVEGTTLVDKLTRGEFVLTIELVPPKTPDGANIATRLDKYFVGHADGVNVTDCASALLRMSSLTASVFVQRHGLEPVLQMTCRDRNRLAIQADLIGAYALGIRTVLCLSGDHITFGDHPEAKPVYDLDSVNLIEIVAGLREGEACSGDPIQATPKSAPVKLDFLIGAAANPCGNAPEHLALQMEKKMRAGADFLQTQPVFDVPAFMAWHDALRARGVAQNIKILPGILPPKGAKGLEFMRDNVPGMRIPEEIIRRMQQAEKPEVTGKQIALEIAEQLMEREIDGLHLYPVYWEALMPELATDLRALAARKGRRVAQAA